MAENKRRVVDGKEPFTVGTLRRALEGVRDDALVLLDPFGGGPTRAFTTLDVGTVRRIGRGESDDGGVLYRIQEKGERGIPAVLLD